MMNLFVFKICIFPFLYGKNTVFFILCSLFRSPILKIILIKSVCFPTLENLFLHQSSPTKSPTRWWFDFYFFATTWGDDPIWRAYLSILFKPQQKNGELVFFLAPVVWNLQDPRKWIRDCYWMVSLEFQRNPGPKRKQILDWEVHALAFKHEFLGWSWMLVGQRGFRPWFCKRGVPKMVGFPNKPMGFPTKWCIILGCEMGVPPFKETPTSGKQAVIKGHDQ